MWASADRWTTEPFHVRVAAALDEAGMLRPDGATDAAEHLRAGLSAHGHLGMVVSEVEHLISRYLWGERAWRAKYPRLAATRDALTHLQRRG